MFILHAHGGFGIAAHGVHYAVLGVGSSGWSRCSPLASSPRRRPRATSTRPGWRPGHPGRPSTGHGRLAAALDPGRQPRSPGPCAGADRRAAGPAPARGRQLGSSRGRARSGRAGALP